MFVILIRQMTKLFHQLLIHKMKNQIFQGEPVRNAFYYLSGILQILGIIFIVVVSLLCI